MTTPIRKISAAAILLGVALSVTACGSDAPTSTNVPIAAQPSASAIPTTATPIASTAPANATTPKTLLPDVLGNDRLPFTGEAADHFGAANVMAAYKEMAALTQIYTFTGSLMKSHKYLPVEFTFMDDFLTPELRKSWNASVVTALAGSTKDIAEINALTAFNITATENVEFDSRPTRNAATSAATTWVDTQTATPRLGMQFTATWDFVIIQDGKRFTGKGKRVLTFALVPSGIPSNPWLIDSYRTKIVPVPGLTPRP